MMQKGVFTIDEVAGEFKADFLDEERVRSWLLGKLNPEGPRCPHCGTGVLPGRAARTFWSGGRVCCKSCKAYFTASTGTMISGAEMEIREIFLIALLLGFEVPVAEIAEILGRTEETVRAWRTKLAVVSETVPPGAGEILSPPGEGGRARQGAGVEVPFENLQVGGVMIKSGVFRDVDPVRDAGVPRVVLGVASGESFEEFVQGCLQAIEIEDDPFPEGFTVRGGDNGK